MYKIINHATVLLPLCVERNLRCCSGRTDGGDLGWSFDPPALTHRFLSSAFQAAFLLVRLVYHQVDQILVADESTILVLFFFRIVARFNDSKLVRVVATQQVGNQLTYGVLRSLAETLDSPSCFRCLVE